MTSSLPNYKELESYDEFERFCKSGKVIVFKVHSDGCGPCIGTKGLFMNLAQKYTKVGFVVINRDKDDEFIEKVETEIDMPGQKAGDYSPNATIITTGNGGGIPRPKNIVNAISDIQQFYVIEQQGQDIPAEFLTLEGSLDFFRIGIKSGLNEGLFLVLLFPVFSFYLLPFVLKSPDSSTNMIFGSVPYLPVLINTLLSTYIRLYYICNIRR
jgi:thiol-disulfide isomerase/thioredoxin